jgi:murein DD-endopeptidase MepM/ murein hydrolase activator NlpD
MAIRAIAAAALAGVTAVTFGLVVPALAWADHEDQKRDVDDAVERLREQLAESSAAFTAAALQVQEAEAQLAAAQEEANLGRAQLAFSQAKDAAAAAELQAAESAERKAERELDAVFASIERHEELVGQFARSAYRRGAVNQLDVAFETESPAELANRLSMVRTVMDSENSTLEGLASDRAELARAQATLEAMRIETARLREEAHRYLEATAVLEAHAREAETQVAQRLNERRQALAAAESANVEDERQYAAMQAESARLEGELAALAAQARAAKTRYVAPPSGGSGLLAIPVNGRVTSPYGVRKHPISGVMKMHNGTDIGAPCGTPIRAAETGVVVSAGDAGGYGNQTVVNHGVISGQGVATSYNHQSEIGVGVGEQVARGQVIGWVGTTGYSTGCHLHFIVYVNGSHTNAQDGWL